MAIKDFLQAFCHYQWRTDNVEVDLLTLTAVELQRLLDSRIVSSVDIIGRYFDQIEKHNHAGLKLNAVITTAPKDKVLRRAQQLDEERRRGFKRGPFHGVPLLVKDAFNTPELGMPTTCGSHAFVHAEADANAKIVDVLVKAGMIVIGKANMSELGNMKGTDIMAGWSAVGGQTQTPYVEGGVSDDGPWLTHSGPAGSSSGSAVGVVAGFAPISIGTESDGSIIKPASRVGLYALKITVGAADTYGVQPALKDFDCLGGFAKCIPDLARITALLQGIDSERYIPSLSPSWQGLRLGFVDPRKWRTTAAERTEVFFEQTDEATFAAIAKARELGARVVECIPLVPWARIIAAMPDMEEMEDLNPYAISESFSTWLPTFKNGPQTIAELVELHQSHADLEFNQRNSNQDTLIAARDDKTTKEKYDRNFNALRDCAKGTLERLMKDHDVEFILGPSDSRIGSFASAAGFPVINLPLGFAKFNGRAFSLHAIASANREERLLRLGGAWEAAFPKNVKPPPLMTKRRDPLYGAAKPAYRRWQCGF